MSEELSKPRLAGPADADCLFETCRTLWEENGIFRMSENKVRRFIEIAVCPETRKETEPVSIIAAIGPVGAIEASLALCITQNWYTDDWHIEELWNFVRPDRRKSTYAKSLLEYAKTVQAQMNLPLLIGILSSDRTQAKVKLYSRRLGPPSGAYFVWPSWNEMRDEKKQMAEFNTLFDVKRVA
jgi:hypothetical protein